MLRTFQVNDKWKPISTKAALFEGICEENAVKRCQDGRVVEGARLKIISWLRDGFKRRVWVFWSPSGGVGSNPTPGMFQFCPIGKQESSLELMPTCSFSRVQAPDATQLWRTSASSNCWLFFRKTWPSFTKSKQLRMTVFLCNSKLPVWTFLCRTLQDSGFSTLKCLIVLRLIR